MRTLKTIAVIGLLVKAVVVGVLCTDRVARASAEPAAEKKAEREKAAAGVAVPADALAKSRGFREMLDAVERRTSVLDQREQAVTTREASLKALEATLAGEIARLEAQGGDRVAAPKAAAAGAPAAGGAAVGAPAAAPSAAAAVVTGGVAVTKIYESMKPEEAAPILDKLDDATVKSIFGRMKEKQIGALLAVMNRERAVALTKALAGDQH